jgi:Amt family ammonium transporter
VTILPHDDPRRAAGPLAVGFGLAGGLLMLSAETWAQEAAHAAEVNTGDTAWVLAASALMLAMVSPGLALFYSGLVRSKNALATIMHSFVMLCLVSVIWVLWGYTLTFGPDKAGVIGGLDWAGLSGIGREPHPLHAPSIPHMAFVLFQLMFAVITPALITGAFAERVRFSALVLFGVLWSTLIYSPVAHWVWGGGWLDQRGVLDFAGGTVVHISSGMAALACALVLGRRRGYGIDYMAPHNLPVTFLGAGLLWFGWFGFNGGSAFGANATAVNAVIATNTAAATAALTWMALEWMHRGKPTLLGIASGAVTGLASITAGAGYVSPSSAMLIGLAGGLLCYFAIVWKAKIGYDDALDVVGIHAVGGIVGMLAIGLLASKAVNPAGADGLFFGNPTQFGIQLVAVIAVVVYSFVGTFIILKLVDGLSRLRVSPEEEAIGLDLSQHNERAYS